MQFFKAIFSRDDNEIVVRMFDSDSFIGRFHYPATSVTNAIINFLEDKQPTQFSISEFKENDKAKKETTVWYSK